MPMIEKSITKGCFYVGGNLARWMSKKENPISLSITKSDYIAASCYTQLLWMKKMLEDYDFSQNTMTIYYDNSSALGIFKKHIQHS